MRIAEGDQIVDRGKMDLNTGALDLSLYPLSYAGGELQETNIGLMPGLVATYDQGMRWKKEAVGKAVGDGKLQAEGKADKIEGKVQNLVGSIKDSLKP